MLRTVLSISGVFGVLQVVVVGGAARPQLRAIRREELILVGVGIVRHELALSGTISDRFLQARKS